MDSAIASKSLPANILQNQPTYQRYQDINWVDAAQKVYMRSDFSLSTVSTTNVRRVTDASPLITMPTSQTWPTKKKENLRSTHDMKPHEASLKRMRNLTKKLPAREAIVRRACCVYVWYSMQYLEIRESYEHVRIGFRSKLYLLCLSLHFLTQCIYIYIISAQHSIISLLYVIELDY